MVAKIKVLSATTFIQELQLLHGNNWKSNVSNRDDAPGIDVDKDENGQHNQAQAMMSIFSIMGGGNQNDDTARIRNQFLMGQGIRVDNYDRRGSIWGK